MAEDSGLQLPEDLWDIDYDDLELQEEISSGGFGCVWKYVDFSNLILIFPSFALLISVNTPFSEILFF